MASTLKDKILLRRSETESAITDNASLVSDFLFGETVLCYEDGRERLYCKNTENEIVPIHKNADCGEIVIQEQYVDLGLPSGNLWTKCNLGATTEDEAGLYFAWGDTVGYTAEQVGNGEGLKHFSWNDYTFGTSSNLTKYNAIDNKTVLDLEDDAAHAMLGGLWRMPTYDECMELYQNTDIFLVLSNDDTIEANYTAATNEDGMYKIKQIIQLQLMRMACIRYLGQIHHSQDRQALLSVVVSSVINLTLPSIFLFLLLATRAMVLFALRVSMVACGRPRSVQIMSFRLGILGSVASCVALTTSVGATATGFAQFSHLQTQ